MTPLSNSTMKQAGLFLAICVLLSIISLSAQEIDTLKIQKLDEVVISAQFTPRSEKNSIYKVRVINSANFKKTAANNVKDLLQHEMNIDLSQSSVFGSSIEMQGISKENIKILVDGIPVIGRLNGVIDLSQINLSNIERIEIIEGPVSVFYGTDAMGGIINLISKKNQKKTFEGGISAFYETINAIDLKGSFGYKFGSQSIKITGGDYKFGGLSTNNLPRNLNWEEKNQYFAKLNYYKQFKDIQLDYVANFSKEKLISIGEPNKFGKIQDKDYYTRRIDNTISIKGNVFAKHYINTTLSYLDYQRYHNTFDVDPITLNKVAAEKDNKIDNEVHYVYAGFKSLLAKDQIDDNLAYATGVDYKKESTAGQRILDQKQSINTYAFFGSINYKINSVIEIQPAFRYTLNDAFGSLVSPAFNAKIKIDNNSVIRFSYARGFRAPSLKELFLDFRIKAGPNTFIIAGNTDLKVEKSHSFNLDYTFTNTYGKDKNFSIEPAIFFNDISSLIALSEMSSFKRHYINIDNFKSVGGRIDFSYHKRSFNIQTGFSLIGRYNKFTEDYKTESYLYTPEVRTNLNYYVEKVGIDLNLFYKYTGERTGFYLDKTSATIQKTTRKDFSNMDFTLNKSFFNRRLYTLVGIKNIFNVKDIETINQVGEAHARDMQLWGRSFLLQTSYKF
jgi:outer membrane receptor for ferrienterochelin and colicins